MWRRRARHLAAACSIALVGCQSLQLGTGPNLEAKLVALGSSAVTGVAMLRAYDGGVTMSVSFTNAPPGEYRFVVHANGNCSSPNGFSAGPPWAPPGVAVLSPPLLKTDNAGSMSVRLPGYRFDGPDGVRGRAVVLHAGASGSLDAQPGVPNNRVACGVIGTPQSLLAPVN